MAPLHTSSSNMFQVDHLSSVTCDVSAVTPDTLLADFMRRSSVDNIPDSSIVCSLSLEDDDIAVLDQVENAIIERWPYECLKSCKHIPIQPAVFPNRYNNVLSITTFSEIHLFNVSNADAASVVEKIEEKLCNRKQNVKGHVSKDFNVIDFDLESRALNRCFDDIESIIGRIQQNSLDFQNFTARWSEYSTSSSSKKSGKSSKSKETEKRRASELANVTASQVKSEELLDSLQKLKLALIIISRIRSHLQPPSAVSAAQYVNMLFSPLTAIVTTTNQAPFSAQPFAFVKAIDTPLFHKDTLNFILSSITDTQKTFWEQMGDAWNVPIEDWQVEIRPYRPVFHPDNFSPYLSFLDPAVIAVSLSDPHEELPLNSVARNSFEENGKTNGHEAHANAVEAIVEPNENVRASLTENPQSFSIDSRPPLEIQELDDVIAAADSTSENGSSRIMNESEFIDKLFAQNRRVIRAISSFQAVKRKEISVEIGEVFEVVKENGDIFVVKNIYEESGNAPAHCFEDVTRPAGDEQYSDTSTNTPNEVNGFDVSLTISVADSSVANDDHVYSDAHKSSSSKVSSSVDNSLKSQESGALDEEEQVIMPGQSNGIVEAAPQERHSIEAEMDVADEIVTLQPKKLQPDEPIPEKDYDRLPDWMKPTKQNEFALKIKKSNGRVVSVVSQHLANHAEELSVFAKEILQLLETPAGSWWYVRNAIGREGYAPVSSLQEMEFVQPKPPATTTTTTANKPLSDNYNSFDSDDRTLRKPKPRNVIMSHHLPNETKEPAKPSGVPPYVRKSKWTQSQPELVIVEQESETYRNYLLSRRKDNEEKHQPQFGAPILAPFSSRSGNANFDEARQKTASMLSVMLTSQINKRQQQQPSANVVGGQQSDSTTADTTAENSGFDDVVRDNIDGADDNYHNGEKPKDETTGDDKEDNNQNIINGDDDAGLVDGGGLFAAESIMCVSSALATDDNSDDRISQHQSHLAHSLRPNDLQKIRANMNRVADQLNSLAATGLLGRTKPSDITRMPKSAAKKESFRRLQPDSTPSDVRKYLMHFGFKAQVVNEFGKLTGRELLDKRKLTDFESPNLLPADSKRLFNLVRGARELSGMNKNNVKDEEFKQKVIDRRNDDDKDN